MTMDTGNVPGSVTGKLRLELNYDHGTGYFKPYFDGLLEGRAMASKCPACGRQWFPPRAICPADRTRTAWNAIAGTGVVVAVTGARTRLPFTAVADDHTFVLVAMDGAENAVFGRVQTGAAEVAAGTWVALAEPIGEPGHPAQAAQFIVRDR